MPDILILTVCLTLLTGASEPAEDPTLDAPTHHTTQLQTTLPNGMRVVVQSVPWERLARVEVFYSAGSATDPDSLAGLAHLAEHLLTDSGHQHPDGELKRLQTLYSSYSNAYTEATSMCFVSQCLTNFLPEILDLEADRMHGAITDSLSFEREKSVVLEEIAFRSRLSPTMDFLESIFQAAYLGHPLGRDVGGTPESVQRAGSRDFLAFQAERISPGKAVLVVSGPVDLESTLKLVREKFAFGPRAQPYQPGFPEYPPVVGRRIVLDTLHHSGVMIGIACRIPSENTRDLVLALCLVEFLDEARLGLSLRPVPGEMVLMAYSSGDYFRPPTDLEQHWFMDYPPFDPDQDAQSGLGYIWSELGKTLNNLKRQEVFDEARTRALNNLGSRGEISGTGSGTGRVLVNGYQYLDARTHTEILQELTPADLQDFTNRFLHPGRVVVGIRHGRDSGRSVTINMAGRVVPNSTMNGGDSLDLLGTDLIDPVLETYRQADLFQFEKAELPNGIPVHCLVIPDADRWHLGGCRTFPGLKDLRVGKKAGLDYLYNQVVEYDDTQRQSMDDNQPPRKLSYDLSIELWPWLLRYWADGPPDLAAKIAQTLSRRLESREFNKARWSAVLGWSKDTMMDIRDQASNAARAWRWRQLLGDDHPAISRWAPDPGMTSSASYNDLKKVHGKVAGKVGNTVLVATGPLVSEEVAEILKGTFGHRDKRKPESGFPERKGKLLTGQGRVFSDLEKADVRLTLTFGPLPLEQSDESLSMVLMLLEEALQQSLTSRLREQEGLTYAVFCKARPIDGCFLWEVEVTCQPGQAPLALASLLQVLARHAQAGFTPDECARARLALTGRAIVAFSDAKKGLDWLLRLATFGEIPDDPMARIFDVGPDRINAMAAEVLNMDRYVFSATGPMFEEDIDQF